jgi:CHAD domain-containing protein
MRIAAKRLRYLLELSEPLFGAGARRGAKIVKGLQDVLGEIHDCDELMQVADERALDDLAAHTRERRAGLHESFTREWDELQEHDFRGELEAALHADRPREQR